MLTLLMLTLLVKLATTQTTSAVGGQCSYMFYVPALQGDTSNGEVKGLSEKVDRLLNLYTEQQKQNTGLQNLVAEQQKQINDQQRQISSLQNQLTSGQQQNDSCNGEQQNQNQTSPETSNGDIEELRKQDGRLLTLYTEQQKLVTDQQRQISNLQIQLMSFVQHNISCKEDRDQQRETQTIPVTTAFIRWGRAECPVNATTIFTGYAAGSRYTAIGGLSEYMCLPSEPQWANYVDGHQTPSKIYGSEYQTDALPSILSTQNIHGNHLNDNDVPCTYCEMRARTIVTMFAGLFECPDGWYLEYRGYVMGPATEWSPHKHYASPVCIDLAPEIIPGGGRDSNGALFYFVQAACGALPCPPYVEGREIPCVVCSK